MKRMTSTGTYGIASPIRGTRPGVRAVGLALAAALEGRIDCRGKTVAVVGSGGNVDAATFAAALRQA